MQSFYNDSDEYCCRVLEGLIEKGFIPNGKVENKDIRDIKPSELEGFTQCHFFAGIGGWAYALRLAGWPDDFPVWTGSCPCQPFSSVGRRKGFEDERHLWPAWRWLIQVSKPPIVFGEQVAEGFAKQWLAGVRNDLETLGYAVGAASLCAPGVGAPHVRQRFYFVADASRGPTYGGSLLEKIIVQKSMAFPWKNLFNRAGNNFLKSGGKSHWEIRQRPPLLMAHGVPHIMARIIGNSIVPPLAAKFIEAAAESGKEIEEKGN